MQKAFSEMQQPEREWMLEKMVRQEETVKRLVRHLEKIKERAFVREGATGGELSSRLYDIGYFASYALQEAQEEAQ